MITEFLILGELSL